MISYEVYKLIHLISIFFTIIGASILLTAPELIKNKKYYVTIGVTSFFIFVAGMGLIARLGFKHGEPFPSWIWGKLSIWILVNFTLFVFFKYSNSKHRKVISLLLVFLVLIEFFLAIFKPF